ncbi:MAG TPA: methyl-accepting chemotaxis protein [Gemmatimonadales bacterium]
MTVRQRVRVPGAIAVRVIVSTAAVGALVAAFGAYVTGAAPLGDNFGVALVTLVLIGAVTRRFGVPLPGNGFSSYIIGVVFLALLARGGAFATLVAPFAITLGDVFLRRLPLRAALTNAAHLTTGSTIAGLIYERLGGATGPAVFTAANVLPLAALALLLTLLVNGTFYFQLALERARAWSDWAMTLRWEAIVCGTSAALALGWLRYTQASLPTMASLIVAGALLAGTAASVWVIRVGVRADELRLIQGLSRAISGDISLARSFPRIQEFTRSLVPWEHMGFARYDPRSREMELIADTALDPARSTPFRFDADAGLSGEALRLRQPVVAHALTSDQVVIPGSEKPGAEVLVPLYHGGQLVGVWSVRHSDPLMYRESDGELLNLLSPQLALMLALESSVQPVAGASDQTSQYVQTLNAAAEEIHASSKEVARAAARASQGAAEAAGLVSATAQEAAELGRGSGDLAAAGEQTRDAGNRMQATAEKVRGATRQAVRRLGDLSTTTEEGAAEVQRLRDVAAQVEKFSETIGFVANQTNLLALNATIAAARAGVHGRGFAVVADEVHKLAEESGREARNVGRSVQETRRALDRAAQLLDRIRSDLSELVQQSGSWLSDLDLITQAASATATGGKRVAEVARTSAEQCARIAQSLEQALRGAHTSQQEAEAVAAAAAEQLKAIGALTRGAGELETLADSLSRAVRFVRGENGR